MMTKSLLVAVIASLAGITGASAQTVYIEHYPVVVAPGPVVPGPVYAAPPAVTYVAPAPVFEAPAIVTRPPVYAVAPAHPYVPPVARPYGYSGYGYAAEVDWNRW
jgi:hypothetical protein